MAQTQKHIAIFIAVGLYATSPHPVCAALHRDSGLFTTIPHANPYKSIFKYLNTNYFRE
ncbi:hypothetical protein [Flavobacterium segetis]|uniref:hypothetical protein n=1 Tax=Flavobacterium segetis TaxID=271157 RepID=UPI0013564946|nr:hypothetical protein [Flavobacterium segetis]